MPWFFDLIRQTFSAMFSREPMICRRGDNTSDWLPPVVGAPGMRPYQWQYELMAGMADGSNAWYFDRRHR